jgi:hypothetical protein
MPGTNVPGVITAGTFYQDGKRVFWDVHHPEKTVVIDLHDERYNELVVDWMIQRSGSNWSRTRCKAAKLQCVVNAIAG